MSTPPTGTVTFLFTDMEGSTRLLQKLGDEYEAVEVEHARILREAIADGGGTEIRTEGDSFFAVFPRPGGAVRAAVTVQRALANHRWARNVTLRVRMGMHTGEGKPGGSGSAADYVGIDVNRAARVASAAHGGQVLISNATQAIVEHSLPEGVTIRDLGEHRLKDIEHPERLFDLVIDGLPADFPPVRTLTPPTNLPPERTPFVGRGRDMEEVARLLGSARLITLTGPGGTGKTRLALRAAAEQLGRFADGVFLVDLSVIVDPDLVLSEIASALRVREEAGRNLLDSLGDHLRNREVLLVLDNFEQVADAAPGVGRLLDAAPRLTILATSRVPLRLVGEREFHVTPLALPDPDQTGLEALAHYEAVMLFVERAVAVRPSFQLTEANVESVAEIATRLDGLPLAIELAASRMKVLDPRAMLSRLEQSLPLLTGGARDLPKRQRTLRSTIDWSHDLLSREQRRLFARLSVFAGGCMLEVVEDVCGPDLGADVLDGLGALVDGSLVNRGETDDGVRFQMLVTIQEYAAERLAESGEERTLKRRHAQYVRTLAEEAEPHLTGEGQEVWLARLENDHGNVRAALDWAIQAGEAEPALRTVAAAWRFWQHRAGLSEGRARTEALLALPAAQARDPLRARALGALGSIAYWQGDYGPMRLAYEEAAEIAREIGDSRLIAKALYDLSFAPGVEMNLDGQEELLRESLAKVQGADAALTADIWIILGSIEMFRGNPQAAVELIERGTAVHRGAGDAFLVSESLTVLAGAKFLMGDVEAAKGLIREAVGGVSATRSMTYATLLLPLALVATLDGRHRRAASLLGASARIRDELGGGPPSFQVMPFFGDPEASAREALGDEEYERARAEGYAMSFEEGSAFAMDDSAVPGQAG